MTDPSVTVCADCLRTVRVVDAETGKCWECFVRAAVGKPVIPQPGDAPTPDALDVERLALAIACGDASQLDVHDEWWTTPRDFAADIAREYAALSPSGTSEETRP